MKKQLGIANQDDYLKQTIIFTSFASASPGSYLPVASIEYLKKVVDTKLLEYNESNAMMDLVLFEQAAEHITRISRIIANPSGNAMVINILPSLMEIFLLCSMHPEHPYLFSQSSIACCH